MSGANTPKDILLVFIKNPVLGQVKTRIAEKVGDDEALRIYLELLRITREQTQGVAVEKWVCYSQYIPDRDAWQMAGFQPYLQSGADLGERMSQAFHDAFAVGHRVVLIGSDMPHITTALVETAFDALLNNEMVIGPSEDGGYYLIGMNRPMPSLFQDISWSTPHVMTQTKTKTQAMGIEASELPTHYDVDYIQDWERLAREK